MYTYSAADSLLISVTSEAHTDSQVAIKTKLRDFPEHVREVRPGKGGSLLVAESDQIVKQLLLEASDTSP